MFTDFFKNLKEELKKDLPGEKAHVKMSPGIRDYFKPTNKTRKAGVLILLFPKNQELYLAFIQRTEYNGPHSGQISFPGGKAEDFDKNIIDTALRECHEEIGINPSKVKILGKLTPLHIPVSNFMVSPIMGIYKTTPQFKADPVEVEKVLEIKLKDLLDPTNCTTKEFSYGDISFLAPIYNPNNITIWGATAMMLSEFLEVVKKNNAKFLV
ncbi:MAG: CoA pyrophosphatase [Bacteroidales bacterium]|nr:CoA pyrophosphatase [Bacteroidales bacterium]